ncbi:MAG TPA: hypothetical protein VMA75_01165 [Candidatus Paceibacterota bacterium]|nr:hypothetical protein [Candidatus Paceibacterota bacterium]
MDHKGFFKKGQAFLALTFFIGGILAIAGILIAFFALSYIDTGYGAAASFRADAAATAGAEDALLQLDRNAAFSNTSGYAVNSGSASATVTVTQNSPSAGQVAILSASTVGGHTKKISAVVSEDPTTGQVSVVSWTEIQ